MYSLDDLSLAIDERAAVMPGPCDRCHTPAWELHNMDMDGFLVPLSRPGARRVCGDCVRG